MARYTTRIKSVWAYFFAFLCGLACIKQYLIILKFTKMEKLRDLITILVIVSIILFGCTTMRTGYYEIKEIRGLNTVVFKELPNEDYHVPRADTLKVGQKIHLQRVFKEKNADVW